MNVFKRVLAVVVVGGVLSANVFAFLAWREAAVIRATLTPPEVTIPPLHVASDGQPNPSGKPGEGYTLAPSDVIVVQCKWKELGETREQSFHEQLQIRPDGTVTVSQFGQIYVNGMTTAEATIAIRKHLTQKIGAAVEGTVEVTQYNSRCYFVIVDGGGSGERIAQFPYSGTESICDAIASIGGLPDEARKREVWVQRNESKLPVDLEGIILHGRQRTNYGLLPNDRVHIGPRK